MRTLVSFSMLFSILWVTPAYAGWFAIINKMAEGKAGSLSRIELTDAKFMETLSTNRAWNDIVSGGQQNLLHYFNNKNLVDIDPAGMADVMEFKADFFKLMSRTEFKNKSNQIVFVKVTRTLDDGSQQITSLPVKPGMVLDNPVTPEELKYFVAPLFDSCTQQSVSCLETYGVANADQWVENVMNDFKKIAMSDHMNPKLLDDDEFLSLYHISRSDVSLTARSLGIDVAHSESGLMESWEKLFSMCKLPS